MELDQEKINRLEAFFKKIKEDTYPEPIMEPHLSITKQMIDYFFNKYSLSQGSKIIDVGCGQGAALEVFSAKGFHPIGITLNDEDVLICEQKGFEIYEMDQSFLDFPVEEFDFIWCRHCLEHSIFPYFTLCEFFRLLKPRGYLYVEVPAPDTSCHHEKNQNHYSVLGKSMWIELIKRSGFTVLDAIDLSFEVPTGPDIYWVFIQQKQELKKGVTS
jgi:SAM-dependent methyltransferase